MVTEEELKKMKKDLHKRIDEGRAIEAERGYVELKWGTLKSWNITSIEGKALLKKYGKLGHSISAMEQRDTPEQKKIICELIDLVPGEIFLDWDDKYVSKEAAKKYVLEYGG